jgi:hypothetical protein
MLHIPVGLDMVISNALAFGMASETILGLTPGAERYTSDDQRQGFYQVRF